MAISGADIRDLTDNGLAESAGLISRREYNLSIVRSRQTAELLIKSYAAEHGLPYTTLADTIETLYEQGIINRNSRDAFHNIRIYGNKAVHDGDNNPENAQKSYYMLKSEVSTFLSRKTVSVDRTPIRVETGAGGAKQLGELEVEIAGDPYNTAGRRVLDSARQADNAGHRRTDTESYDGREQSQGYRTGNNGRQSSSDRNGMSGDDLLDNSRRRFNRGDNYEDGFSEDYREGMRYADSDGRNRNRRSGREGSSRLSDIDESRPRSKSQGRSSRDGGRTSEGSRHGRSSGGSNADRLHGNSRDDRRNQGRGGRKDGRSGRSSRDGRNKNGREARSSFTVYDLLRILLPVLVIVLLIVIIRSFMAAKTPKETVPETTTVIETTVQETETEPETTEPETTEPETTAAAIEYRIAGDGVNIRYADNQNRIYTQLSKGTAIGTVTPIEGSDYVSFTLDGVNVVVRKDMLEPIS